MTATDSTMVSSAVSVYLLGGQSNMEGQGVKSSLTAAQTTYDNPVKYWNGSSFENLTTSTITSSTANRFGPEYGFAKEVSASAGETIYIIKYAYSGRGLDYRWNNVNHNQDFNSPVRDPNVNPASYDNFYPGLSSGHGSSGSRYNQMINAYTAGLASLANAGLAPDVKGFIWMQGEQDSKNALSAEAYSDNLSLLYSRVGEDVGDSAFDLTFGKVLPDAPGFDNTRFGSRDAIREDMEEADEGSGHPDAIAGATLMA